MGTCNTVGITRELAFPHVPVASGVNFPLVELFSFYELLGFTLNLSCMGSSTIFSFSVSGLHLDLQNRKGYNSESCESEGARSDPTQNEVPIWAQLLRDMPQLSPD
jgi:hypothetical protein